MTEEYKKGILDYISGNITPESEKNNAFRDNETIQNNLTTKLAEKGITILGGDIDVVFDDKFPNYVMYGMYTKGNKSYSWIAIISETGEVLDILTTYESGMPIEPIYDLHFDENGNMYGIDYPNASVGEYDYFRIVLFNNMTIPIRNKYICKLRSSYYIKNKRYDVSVAKGNRLIGKVPGEARYYIVGIDYVSSPNTIIVIQFSNIVGLPTEWNYYAGTSIDSYISQCKFIIEKHEEKETLDIYYRTPGIVGLGHEYFDGEKIIQKQTVILPNQIFDIAIENSNTVYVAARHNNNVEDPDSHTYTMYVYKIQNSSYEELYSFTQEVIDIPRFYLTIKDGIVFSKMETFISSQTWGIICSAYYNGKYIQSPTYQYTNINTFTYTTCNVKKTFNLYTFIVQNVNEIYSPSIVVYTNQYSGASRSYYDYTLPSHCEIYSNGYIKYARDLYNRQVYQNQCLSTANVPYNYLNDMELSPANLISGSMTTLESYTTPFEKNKYENLFINYMNKINVIDEDTNTIYNSSANYINENINTGNETNYNNTFIGKVMINYSTPVMKNIQWIWNTDHYETSFTIYTNEIPTSIEFMSNDETTSYLTKEIEGLSLNKYYTISQKLRIE